MLPPSATFACSAIPLTVKTSGSGEHVATTPFDAPASGEKTGQGSPNKSWPEPPLSGFWGNSSFSPTPPLPAYPQKNRLAPSDPPPPKKPRHCPPSPRRKLQTPRAPNLDHRLIRHRCSSRYR